jgi:pantoate--beta-alanine ligase
MGYLHEGHLSLVRLARRHAGNVIVSLFVNPTQFGPGEDFDRYPRDRERDETLCRREGVNLLFCPSAPDLYAPDASTAIVEERLSPGLCGASRPGHFRGVCTIVAKLFHLCDPDVAVFGSKDAQQVRVIERMVRDLNFPVRIVRGPTVREPDGLAMSSRNARLSPEERRQASCLRRALDRAEALFAGGERKAAVLTAAMTRILEAESLARMDYIRITAEDTLEPLETLDRPALVALAVHIGATRLIDNTLLPDQTPG